MKSTMYGNLDESTNEFVDLDIADKFVAAPKAEPAGRRLQQGDFVKVKKEGTLQGKIGVIDSSCEGEMFAQVNLGAGHGVQKFSLIALEKVEKRGEQEIATEESMKLEAIKTLISASDRNLGSSKTRITLNMASEGQKDITINLDKLHPDFRQILSLFDSDGNGEVSLSEVKTAIDSHDRQVEKGRNLRSMVICLLALLFVSAWSTFGMSFWAVTISKDTQASQSQNGVPALTGMDGSFIMQTAPAKSSGVALKHAPVMDMEHLRTVEEITFTIPAGMPDLGTGAYKKQVSEKVVSVRKLLSPVPTVEFETHSKTILVIDVNNASAIVNGMPIPLCGELTCGNFKVDDPLLDVTELDKRLEALVGSDKARRLFLGSACMFFAAPTLILAPLMMWWSNDVTEFAESVMKFFRINDFAANIVKFFSRLLAEFLPLVEAIQVDEAKIGSRSFIEDGLGAPDFIATLASAAAYGDGVAVMGISLASVIDPFLGAGPSAKTLKAKGWTEKQVFIVTGRFQESDDRAVLWEKDACITDSAANCECMIAFRGSDDVVDILHDITFWYSDSEDYEIDGALAVPKMSVGVKNEFDKLWRKAKEDGGFELIRTKCHKLTSTGHSLGGALASVFAYVANLPSDPMGLKKTVDKLVTIGAVPPTEVPLTNGVNNDCFPGSRFINVAAEIEPDKWHGFGTNCWCGLKCSKTTFFGICRKWDCKNCGDFGPMCGHKDTTSHFGLLGFGIGDDIDMDGSLVHPKQCKVVTLHVGSASVDTAQTNLDDYTRGGHKGGHGSDAPRWATALLHLPPIYVNHVP